MRMTIEPTAILSVTDDAIASDVDGEVVLISIASSRYFGFDRIGSEIWRRLQTPKTFDTLCTELKAACEGDPATIERETGDFVTKLMERGLVRESVA